MKSKTLLTVGGLAVLGVLGYNYYKKNKSGATGYSNANGMSKKAFPNSCLKCRTSDGGTYVPPRGYTCAFSQGERCLTS